MSPCTSSLHWQLFLRAIIADVPSYRWSVPLLPQELLDEIERLKSAVANALAKANAKYADAAKELEAALMLPIGQAVQRFKEIIDSLFEYVSGPLGAVP